MSEGVDAAARVRALDPATSLIVRAPAGAGKTELLVQRYLALLATVAAPEAIVAITFTVKAAGEMRTRILAALAQAERGATGESDHAQRTLSLSSAALARDRARGWRLSENPARLQVQTIDALCLRLARRLPLLARAQADLRISERPRPLYRAAARMLLEEIEEPEGNLLATLLLHVDGDESRLLELIADMLAERDRWLRHVARTDASGMRRAALEENLAVTVEEALEPLAASTPVWLAEALPALAARSARARWDAADDSPVHAWATLTAMPPPVASALPAWRGLAELLLTARGEPRRQPRAMHVGTSLQVDRDGWHALLHRLPEAAEWCARLALVRELPSPRYDDVQWRVCEALLALLPRAAACLKLVFADAGVLDFTEIAHAALRALGEADAPTDLALALDQRIEHLLVDEFQDTSYTQLDLLVRLTAGWTAGDGRSLFLVGDPMQSIYRFREAEVALFGRVERYGLGGLVPERLRLRRNFRAQERLVDWVNGSFATLFAAAPGEGETAIAFDPAVAACAALDGTAVSIHPQPPGDVVAEARSVLEIVAAARREGPQASVAILVRAREHLSPILRELRHAGLPFRAVDVEPLARVPAVQDLHALTRALLHLGDRVAWLAVLRAPWCGLTLGDLHALAYGREEQCIWEVVVEERAHARLSEDARRRLARLERVLGDSLAERGRHGLRRSVEGAWMALGGAACLRNADEWANAQRYLRLLEELDRGGEPVRLEELDESLAELYADPDPAADERLQLMTIHRAKGLEFDVVIVPSLGRSPGRRAERLLTVIERASGTASRLLVAPIAAADAQDPLGRYLRQVEERADGEEAVRLLYVAATRARHRLHLLGAARSGRNGVQPRADSLLARLWPAVREQFRAIPPAAGDGALGPGGGVALGLDDRIRRLPSGWVLHGALPAGPARMETAVEDEPEFAWASDVARQVGRAVHRALERIGKDGIERWRSLGEQGQQTRLTGLLRELGTPRSRLVDAVARAHGAVRNTLDDARGRWLLEHAHADARSERELSAWIDDRLVTAILDRTFVDEHGVRWIVDFKTGAHEGGALEEFIDGEVERYRPQLERYARLMRHLDERPLRVGLYFPLLKEWREWEP